MVDLAAVLDAVGVDPGAPVQPVGGGADTRTWKVGAGTGALALRVFRPGMEPLVAREAAAIDAAARAGLPVPVIVARSTVDGRGVVLATWLDGRPMLDVIEDEPACAQELGEFGGRMQARIAQVAAPAPWPIDDWARWHASPRAAVADPGGASSTGLLHLDCHPGNLLVDDRGEVTGIVDWINARRGPAVADLARTYTILRTELLVRPASARVIRALWRGWLSGHRSVAGGGEPLGPWVAWAGDRIIPDLGYRLDDASRHRVAQHWRRWHRCAMDRATSQEDPRLS